MPWAPTYRPVQAADGAFLLRVYASTRAEELALTGWDTATCDAFVQMQFNAQLSHYRHHWPQSNHSVIEVMAQGARHDVGRLWLDRRADTVHVLDIALLRPWCGRGIGSACLLGLQRDASRRGVAVSVHVEQGNPARRLYDRLGFTPAGPLHGIHQLLSWRHDTDALASPHKETCSEQA